MNVGGGVKAWFPGCPAAHRDSDVNEWLRSYTYWNKHHKTPVDLGFVPSFERLSPIWFDVMDLIESEISRIREEETQRPREGTMPPPFA